MRSLAEIQQRDAVLHALDAITIGILGNEWSVAAHIRIKTMLLNLINDKEDNQ
jgi:hypothetical protein